MSQPTELIVRNARITTVDRDNPQAQALAVAGGKFIAVGDEAEIMATADKRTHVIDARRIG